jgi:hypothetical protein
MPERPVRILPLFPIENSIIDLVIAMPAYDESGCIEAVTLDWLKIFDRRDGCLIAINDASKDKHRRDPESRGAEGPTPVGSSSA